MSAQRSSFEAALPPDTRDALMELLLLPLLALALIPNALLTMFIAISKGHSLWWLLWGLLLGPLALLAAVGLPDLVLRDYTRRALGGR